MELETINKLYLELSQVATAETQKQRANEDKIAFAYSTLLQIMDAIDGHAEWSPHPEVDNDTWNPDAHIEITLTVDDCRRINKTLDFLRGEEGE